MKKRYISPFVEFVDMTVMPIMTTASSITAPEEEDGGRGNDTEQAGGHRGDWENIWGNM